MALIFDFSSGELLNDPAKHQAAAARAEEYAQMLEEKVSNGGHVTDCEIDRMMAHLANIRFTSPEQTGKAGKRNGRSDRRKYR